MLIERVETWACSVPLPKPLSFGAFSVRSREYAAIRVITRGGLFADCLGHTRRSPVDVAICDIIAPCLVGKNALDLSQCMAKIASATLAIETDGVIGRARSLAEVCLWDLHAQWIEAPVWRLLGGSPRALRVALVEGYAIGGEEEDDLVRRLTARTDEGYEMLKMEAAHYREPRPIHRMLAKVAAHAKAEFVCDLAWSWRTAREGLAAARLWADLDVAWIEDPMPRGMVDQIAFLRQRSPLPIGVGDESSRPADLEILMAREAVDVVRIDATSIGGFTAAMRLAAMADAKGLRTSFHVNPEIHQHCILAAPGCDHIEMFPADRPFDCSHELIEEPCFGRVRDARLPPPEQPGTGLRLKNDAVARFAYRHNVRERA